MRMWPTPNPFPSQFCDPFLTHVCLPARAPRGVCFCHKISIDVSSVRRAFDDEFFKLSLSSTDKTWIDQTFECPTSFQSRKEKKRKNWNLEGAPRKLFQLIIVNQFFHLLKKQFLYFIISNTNFPYDLSWIKCLHSS